MHNKDSLSQNADNYMLKSFITGRKSPLALKYNNFNSQLLDKIHKQWDSPSYEKEKLLKWHIDYSDSTTEEYIELLIEALNINMLEDIIEILTIAYEKNAILSVDDVHKVINMNIKEGFPYFICISFASTHGEEDIEKYEKEQEEKKNKKKNRLTIQDLKDKWK